MNMVKPGFDDLKGSLATSDLKRLMDVHTNPLVFSDIDSIDSNGVYIGVVLKFLLSNVLG